MVVRPLQAAFSSSRLTELEEAARIHGANDWQIFRRITLPLVRPSLAAGLLLGCARVSGEVGMTMMLGGNIASAPIPFRLKSLRADFDAANALCFILSLFAVLLFLATEVLMRRALKS